MANNRASGSYQGGTTAASGSVGGSWGNTPSVTITHVNPTAAAPPMPSVALNVVADGSYERNLVLELCPPGGMKPVPPPDKLANFRRSVPSLNADLICPILLDLLEEGQPWIIRAKVLHVMETCIEAGTNMTDGANPYRDFLYTCRDEIVPLASHARGPIREPAQSVLKLLGVDFEHGGPPPPTRTAAPVVAAPNLLDFDDETPEVASPVAATPAAAAAVPSNGNMFGGMQVKGPAAGSPPKASQPSSGTLLDFMGDNGATAPTTPAPVAAPPTDVFGTTASTPAPAAAPDVFGTDTSSMFAQMAVKDEEKKHEDNGGSAFGFINAATTEPPKKPTFDPLMNGGSTTTAAAPVPAIGLSPATQQKILAMSPEQMQAMAYQQMMMQQQMQMAALMQQQQRPGGPMMPGMMMPPIFMASPPGAAASPGFSFNAPAAVKKDDKKFDFVKDAMKTAK
jgi:hypothetical protein